MARPVVIYDACVLYCAPIRDLLIRLAVAGLVRPRWTGTILDECFRSIQRNRPDLSDSALSRTRQLMVQAVRDCMVLHFEGHIDSLSLPDPDGRHVLAAALEAQAEAIITFNLRDFPQSQLDEHLVVALSPDAFVQSLLDQDPAPVIETVIQQATALKTPPLSVDELLEILSDNGLPKSAERLRALAQGEDKDKPYVLMNDIEWVKSWDKVEVPLVRGFLRDARDGCRHFYLAVGVLFRPHLTPLVLEAAVEHGDHNGLDFVRSECEQVKPVLKADETLCLELVRFELQANRSWKCSLENFEIGSVSAGNGLRRDAFEQNMRTRLLDAKSMGTSVLLLHDRGAPKGLVFHEWEWGDNEGVQSVSRLARMCKRTGLLGSGELLTQSFVQAKRSAAGWQAIVSSGR